MSPPLPLTVSSLTMSHRPHSRVRSYRPSCSASPSKKPTSNTPPVSPRTATQIFDTTWANYIPHNQPLSTQDAEELLLMNDGLSTTVHATTYGLISTIHCCTT